MDDEVHEPRAGNLLRSVRFAVFGLGNSLYPKFNVGMLDQLDGNDATAGGTLPASRRR